MEEEVVMTTGSYDGLREDEVWEQVATAYDEGKAAKWARSDG